MKALLVDDEPLARKRLARLLAEHPDVEVAGEAASGTELISAVLRLRPDVVFLDVQMPGQDGLSALRALDDYLPDEARPVIVFTTAHEQHAVEAFALEGADYLLKPVEPPQLARALKRVRRTLWARGGTGAPASGPPPAAAGAVDESPEPTPVSSDHVAVRRAGKILSLPVADIACVTVEDTLTFAHCASEKFDLGMPLHEAERRLPSPPFLQVSRSAIVNVGYIDHLSPGEAGTFTAVLKAPLRLEIDVSRRRARELRALLGF